MKKTLYAILGVQQNSPQEAIDEAYTGLLNKMQALGHDDASVELFSIRNAYDVLSDPKKRTAYDEKTEAKEVQHIAGVSDVTEFTGATPKKTSRKIFFRIDNVKRVAGRLLVILLVTFIYIGYLSFRKPEISPNRGGDIMYDHLNSCIGIARRLENRPLDLYPTVESLADHMRETGQCK